MLAYYSARSEYSIIRELSSGYGFADITFIPKSGVDKPAMIIELKWNDKVETAINQIKQNKYDGVLKDNVYKGKLILVGISYNKEKKETQETIYHKEHRCMIEEMDVG